VLDGEEFVWVVCGEEDWDREEVKGAVSGDDFLWKREEIRRTVVKAMKMAAMCQENRIVIHSGDTDVLSFSTRNPPCTSQEP